MSLIEKIASRISRLAALVEIVDLSQMKHPEDLDNIQIFEKSDPKYDSVFKFFETFDIPVSVFRVTQTVPGYFNKTPAEFLETIRKIHNPNAINVIHTETADMSPGWVAHDLFHVLLERNPDHDILAGVIGDNVLAGLLDLDQWRSEFDRAFRKDFATALSEYSEGADIETGPISDMVMRYISDTRLKNKLVSVKLNQDTDMYPDLFISWVLRNGQYRSVPLRYVSTYLNKFDNSEGVELGNTSNPVFYEVTVGFNKGRDAYGYLGAFKILPDDPSLPALTETLDRFNRTAYDTVRSNFQRFIGRDFIV